MKPETRSVVPATPQEPQFLAMQSIAGENNLGFNQEARFRLLSGDLHHPILQLVRIDAVNKRPVFLPANGNLHFSILLEP
jgi:hypothetical protein